MPSLCDQFSKISNYSSEVLCCDKENDNGSGCKIAKTKNCLGLTNLLTQCRKISELGLACKGRDEKSPDKKLADDNCSDDSKWLCLATNDIRDSDNHPDWDAQRLWVITGRLFTDNRQPAPSRSSMIDSPNSCGACCSKTICEYMGNGNASHSCQYANGFTQVCPSHGSIETRIKCPDLFQLGSQTCRVVPFSPFSNDSTVREINYQADLCSGFSNQSGGLTSNQSGGLTADGKAGVSVGVITLVVAVIGIINRKWVQKKWRNFKNKRGVNINQSRINNSGNISSEQGSAIELTVKESSQNDNSRSINDN